MYFFNTLIKCEEKNPNFNNLDFWLLRFSVGVCDIDIMLMIQEHVFGSCIVILKCIQVGA